MFFLGVATGIAITLIGVIFMSIFIIGGTD